MDKKRIVIKYFKVLGNILAAISIFFVIYRLYKMDFDWRGYENKYQLYIFTFLFSFLVLFNNFMNAYAWKRYVDFFSGVKNSRFQLVNIYLKANIEKYLPGNVIQYAGRNLLAKEYGVSQKSIVAASIMELLWISVSAIFFSILISIQNVKIVGKQLWSNPVAKSNIVILMVLSVVIVFALSIVLRKTKYWGLIRSYFNRRFLSLLGETFIIYVINFGLSGLLLSLIFRILHCKINFINIASANILAWLAGYVVPGSPGGIGIREAVLILLLSVEYSKGVVALAAVLLRVCGIVGDFLSYFMVLWLEVSKKRKTRYVS